MSTILIKFEGFDELKIDKFNIPSGNLLQQFQ